MRSALAIAGFDPSGSAGVSSDALTFTRFGLRPLCAITALTAQNGVKVRAVQAVSARFLVRQVTVLLEEFNVRAVKIGMLGSLENAAAVARLIKRRGLPNVVLDTPLRSSDGFPLIGGNAREALKPLIQLSRVVTPNVTEASALSGVMITDVEGMEEAARRLSAMGAANVLVKGGHLKGAPVDVLYDGRRFTRFTGTRVRGGAARLHGTGCLLSAAIAASLAKGRGVRASVEAAKAYVEETLRSRGRN